MHTVIPHGGPAGGHGRVQTIATMAFSRVHHGGGSRLRVLRGEVCQVGRIPVARGCIVVVAQFGVDVRSISIAIDLNFTVAAAFLPPRIDNMWEIRVAKHVAIVACWDLAGHTTCRVWVCEGCV